MSQVWALAHIFGECREGQIPRSLLRIKLDTPSACCGVFDCKLIISIFTADSRLRGRPQSNELKYRFRQAPIMLIYIQKYIQSSTIMIMDKLP